MNEFKLFVELVQTANDNIFFNEYFIQEELHL